MPMSTGGRTLPCDRPTGDSPPGTGIGELPAARLAELPAAAVLAGLAAGEQGLTGAEAAHRLAVTGPNALRSHRARAWPVLARQLRSAVLLLLLATATVSFLLGEHSDALIIAAILAASVGLGFVNEYRAERATEALHTQVQHTVVAIRDGAPRRVDVVDLVPGDVVHLTLGTVVPADLRLLSTSGLECDESILTGESLPAAKSADPVPPGRPLAELGPVAFLGTVVHAGAGVGVVARTGTRTEFGRIAAGLGQRQPETDFQQGLRRFSVLLLEVATVLTSLIFVTNLILRRSLIDSLLFSLAIAVGITPQLLPAVVSTSLAAGSRQLARRKVLVKRLVCIEDLGDLDILVTDKTGTLTEGAISFDRSLDVTGAGDDRPALLGLLASDVEVADGRVVGGNPLDVALWQAHRPPAGYRRLGELPFDHERQLSSTVVLTPDGDRLLVTKGAPEAVLARCAEHDGPAAGTVAALFEAGSRVVAVASRPAPGLGQPTAADERDLVLAGFLAFRDPPKDGAAESLRRLAGLGIEVKIATGDNPRVARRLCAELGLPAGSVLTGPDLDALTDTELAGAAQRTTVFARISPEHKARIVRALRRRGRAIGFLGDGVNDALALHQADIGISVDTAADVAKDAADVVLLEKSLDVLADGVAEGRRIFANTIKYVLMGTSSNFGNMFSAAAASALLPFLPMLPAQILLTNLLYDSSQLTIPTDHVDPEQLAAPSHWDLGFIRRFMLTFGPISSLFDFVTFGVMLGPLHAGAELFRSGWFVESLATQTLIIFAIRTRRVPFTRSTPSRPLTVATLAVVAAGVALPLSPLAGPLGFTAPPLPFYLALVGMVLAYLVLIEVAKTAFFAEPARPAGPPVRRRRASHAVHRRAARFSTAGR
ncbi:MAG TPA: magnesium-translocating P-type ATPase [Jatrophihabitans sp.]|nr:magnesium-translocating P-type ATPase [Jatrophihabitans sp.]